jgi:mRNA interferase MazF
MAAYVPAKGDFVILSFDPQSGHEQQGRRPAMVISNQLFNKATGLAIVCPITHTNRGIPFHVSVPPQSSLTGYIMVEQVKSVDFVSRQIKFVEKAPVETVMDVLGILDAAVYQNP